MSCVRYKMLMYEGIEYGRLGTVFSLVNRKILLFSIMDLYHQLTNLISFFFNDTATPEIYTLSLHDALPISTGAGLPVKPQVPACSRSGESCPWRSEEHTSELQSRVDLVCRLLLEKKKI